MFLDPEEHKSYDYLLDPKFDWSPFDQETLVGIVMEFAHRKKIAHRVIGKAAVAQGNLKTRTSLRDFAKQAEVDEGSISAYKSIENTFKDSEIPPDINYAALAALARQENPLAALKEAIDHGLTNAMICRTFRKEPTEQKTLRCPKCNVEIRVGDR